MRISDWSSDVCSSDLLAPALGILADVTRNPAFAADEIERARAQAIDAANVQMTDPMALAGLVANRATFGAQPYGHALQGPPASLAALTQGDTTAACPTGRQHADVPLDIGPAPWQKR